MSTLLPDITTSGLGGKTSSAKKQPNSSAPAPQTPDRLTRSASEAGPSAPTGDASGSGNSMSASYPSPKLTFEKNIFDTVYAAVGAATTSAVQHEAAKQMGALGATAVPATEQHESDGDGDTGKFSWHDCGLKLVARLAAIITALALVIGGIVTVISLTAICWIVAIYMVACGSLILIGELPLLFQWAECCIWFGEKLSKLTYWWKMGIYYGLSIFCFFCGSVSSIVAGIFLILTGGLHMMVAIGRRRTQRTSKGRADDVEMLLRAAPKGGGAPGAADDAE